MYRPACLIIHAGGLGTGCPSAAFTSRGAAGRSGGSRRQFALRTTDRKGECLPLFIELDASLHTQTFAAATRYVTGRTTTQQRCMSTQIAERMKKLQFTFDRRADGSSLALDSETLLRPAGSPLQSSLALHP